MNLLKTLVLAAVASCSLAGDRAQEKPFAEGGFVLIPETEIRHEGKPARTDAFEILDHPVTNAEYRLFVEATGHRAPLHWKEGKIPAGREEYPVIFVNRYDADAYTEWLTRTTGRVYRIPTTVEFRVAAQGGPKYRKYFWGDKAPSSTSAETVNYNRDGKRVFNEWDKYLKPARWGAKNPRGLYQMAGNVWQFALLNDDQCTTNFKYRIYCQSDIERSIMGGGWCSPAEFLTCGSVFAQSPGLCYPDLGIRLVREPEGKRWSIRERGVAACADGDRSIALSWALLPDDSRTTAFNIYRQSGKRRMHSGFRINDRPVRTTSFADTTCTPGERYQYRIVPVLADGTEGNPSEWVGADAGSALQHVVAVFKPYSPVKTGMTPVFGDLEGNGRTGCVIRLDNGNKENSQDPGIPVQLEAFSYTGKSLWRKNIADHDHVFGSECNAPFNVWDMDGDGRDEVITLLQIGEQNYVAILDGLTGKVLRKSPWDPMETDMARSSTRIQMSIACLDGKNPAVITQTGIYENEVISAYDAGLNRLWTFKSLMETSGSGGHKVEVIDVDGDGRQEIFYGTTCLNHDGTVRWSIYKSHPDLISIRDYIPSRPGLEVCYAVETSSHAGLYMVDASTGEILWAHNRENDPAWRHAHINWTADIWDGSEGIECVSNRNGHKDHHMMLYSAEGKLLMDGFPYGYTPVKWSGEKVCDLLHGNGDRIGRFDGREIVPLAGERPNPIKNSSLIMTADLWGDYREELVVSGTDTDGRRAVFVITATRPIDRMYVTPRSSTDYRLWLARNKGGGYGSVYDYPLELPKNK
ncbi:rhamnogalacturonan lyase family protein [Gallalistipes aquisgranensis]|uniref:rhamnogalacturonan lyase family protein n=1 Tax=Gallalistipes aquisgranensis TaxID=2779358 RepID=UPI001CF8826F|nr:SUMF1/EgtB/PvdO family nonheme iron enzyme [Gallalistipes aquisgranensis]MBE5034416.1 SUMF1/EgtB/PvdO family nonheme iron enzyme [Gallalistipes aquisgranensis]